MTMGLLSLPTMLKRGYSPQVATGVIAASGTLGQIIPPSIVLVLLGDVLSSSFQQSQLQQGNYSPETVSVGDLFVGAIIPGLILVLLYMLYVVFISFLKPETMPPAENESGEKKSLGGLLWVLAPPLFLMVAVLGSLFLVSQQSPKQLVLVLLAQCCWRQQNNNSPLVS